MEKHLSANILADGMMAGDSLFDSGIEGTL